jgi:hypothetical protein
LHKQQRNNYIYIYMCVCVWKRWKHLLHKSYFF